MGKRGPKPRLKTEQDKPMVTDKPIGVSTFKAPPPVEKPPVVKTNDPTPRVVFEGHGRHLLPLKNRKVMVKFQEERQLKYQTTDQEVIEYLRRDDMKAKGIQEIV